MKISRTDAIKVSPTGGDLEGARRACCLEGAGAWILALLLGLLLLSSCAESFKQIPPDKFNDTIAKRKDIKTSDELIKAYYQYRQYYSEVQARPRLNITSRKLDSGDYEITAIDTIVNDDALAAEKIVMIATRKAETWKALDIKYNWKAREGYGSSEWGTGN
jgi:hypothetical protein